MQTLRTRLIFSHIVPLLIVAPLLGLTVYYLLQTQHELTSLSSDLQHRAQQIADIAQQQPDIWADAGQAQMFVEVFTDAETAKSAVQITLLEPGGDLLASSHMGPGGDDTRLALPEVGVVMAEDGRYLRLQADLAQVVLPVLGADEEIVGLVSVTTGLDAVTARVPRLRNLLVGAVAVELLLGLGVGILLAWHLARDLRLVTTAVSGVSYGQPLTPLPERGPTEFRQLFQAYNMMVDRLKTLEGARRQLLANLVHELRRPLGAMQAAVQALSHGGGDDPEFRQALLEGMQGQIDRLRPLLDNLAELHGQVLGTLELNRQPTPLAPWLRQTAVPWQAVAQEKSVQFTMSIADNLPAVLIDGDRLSSAVGNLLSNAIKFTPPGGQVQVAAEVRETAVVITVADTGPGITLAEQARIFTPFYRSHDDTRFPQGMGLGLSIATDIVSAHGGQLELESRRQEGSCFTIMLPHAAAPGSMGSAGQ